MKSEVQLEKEKFDRKIKRLELTREQLQQKIREDIENGKQKVFKFS